MGIIGTIQAAKSLGITPGRVRQLIEAGRLKATRVGREWLIEESDLKPLANRKPGRPRTRAPKKRPKV